MIHPTLPEPTLGRRAFLGGLLSACGLALAAGACAQVSSPLPGYRQWKTAYLRDPGRVIDTGQEDATTSESQGYGMLLALAAGDEGAFESLWRWTRSHLAVREDGLMAWRWRPSTGVTDTNNATDGDLLIAWALASASQYHRRYAEHARQLAQSVRAHAVRNTPWGTVLLPAASGFDTPRGTVINLSYWVFPAFQALMSIDPSPQWEALEQTGLRLLSIARFGRWGLPPDWLLLVDPLAPDPGRPPRYGYEAVRIPLYLAWADLAQPERLAPFRAFWAGVPCQDHLPAWVNLNEDALAIEPALPGMRAIRDWLHGGRLPTTIATASSHGYYSDTLAMLVTVAAQLGGPLRPRSAR